ncbi:heterokaryon incompatibility protein-domain-containing protein [Rhexocercosporidium sp. MPI-PUGE-AT-0058]|nr:heterokaryon incompatibility protein-domain-containing protein [Rhexocercosporidium sp. MPI-PUGE-AT-0058]
MSSAREQVMAGLKINYKLVHTLVRKIRGKKDSARTGESPDDDGDGDDDAVYAENSKALPTAKYQYTDLADAGKCIRILELQPGRQKDNIICRLNEHTLTSNDNEYEALSYVWGEETQTRITIQVNDGSLEIGPSLHCALRFLRHPKEARFLWVDAISINQSSFQERSTQVPLMCEIYRNATSTICFLGPEIATTRAMFIMLEKLAEESKTINNGDNLLDRADTGLAFVGELPRHPVKSKVYEEYFADATIVDIATRTWWHRAWTVQELMLPSKAVLMIGKYTIKWEDLCAAVDYGLNMHIWEHVFLGFIINPVVVPYISMRTLMNRYRLPNQLGTPASDLIRLLVHCRHRKSQDPRDKIYAVLGILRASHPESLKSDAIDAPKIEVGYGKDVREVYRSMARELILKTNTLDVLGVSPNSSLDLPSWVTDWSNTDKIGSPLMQDSLDRTRTTHATRHTKADAHFSPDTSRLILQGFEVSTITTLSDCLPVPLMANTLGSKDTPLLQKFITSVIPKNDSFIPYKTLAPEFESLIANKDSQLAMKFWLYIQHTYSPANFGSSWTANIVLFASLVVFTLKLVAKITIYDYREQAKDNRAVMSVFHTLFTWELFAASQEPTNPGVKSTDVYWNTLCSGTYKDPRHPEDTKAIYEHWYKLLQPLRTFMARFGWLCRAFPSLGIAIYMRATWATYGEFWPYVEAAKLRRLGRLENGWLGMMPKGARVGDVLVLVRGGKVPLVVRREALKGAGEDEMKMRVRFIGEAYVHGIMDGEIWDEERGGEIEIW